MTLPSATQTPGQQSGSDWIVRRAGPRERRWFLFHGLARGIFWLIPFLIAALLWMFWFEVPITDDKPAALVLVGVLILIVKLFWGLLFPGKWLVAIGPREVMVESGIFSLSRVFISYDRVQQIDRTSTPIMSSLDLTQMVLHTASGGVRVYALDSDDAELISDRVRRDKPSPVPESP